MATYNQDSYIREALQSVLHQSFPAEEMEIIVVNDGSTDETQMILSEYSHRLRIVSQANQGLVASCNRGLQLARGACLARLDSDDKVDATWLQLLHDALDKEAEAVCAYPDMYELRNEKQSYMHVDAENLYTLQACGPLFRTDALRRIGGFRKFYWEEYDLYLRLRQLGRFIHVPVPLYTYRKHPASMTNDISRRVAGWLELSEEWGRDTLEAVGEHSDLKIAFKRN